MAKNVLYMRGAFPFSPGTAEPAELIEDARMLLELDPGQLSLLARELSKFSGFLDVPTLKRIVGSFVPDSKQADQLSRLIYREEKNIRETTLTLEDLFSQIAAANQDAATQGAPQLNPAEYEELKSRLTLIIKPYGGLHRQAKAQQLSEATGLPLENLELICDLRPIFDDNRESVEGVIPYTILKIVATGVDGLPVSLETVLTHAEVSELAKKSEAALRKLKRLQELLAEKELPIPPVAMAKKAE